MQFRDAAARAGLVARRLGPAPRLLATGGESSGRLGGHATRRRSVQRGGSDLALGGPHRTGPGLARDESIVRNHLLRAIGDRPLGSITLGMSSS